uniref:Venom protein VP4 n=1 Tax=Odontobuthus doriae TaxID=342590 RepID=A0A0U4HEU8_ODODO|nr:venom protein VP4 [Odontobuthus doriae]
MAKFYCKSIDASVLRADIIMLITKRPLGDYDKNNKFSDNTAGIAFPRTVCHQCYKYGIVTDDNDLNERADTVAHESAHLLGCLHDGEGDERTGSKDCPAKDGYIMGDRNDKNGKKFSSCCKRSVRNQLQKADSRCIIEDCNVI